MLPKRHLLQAVMCAPAVRMLVLAVFMNDDDGSLSRETFPVLALAQMPASLTHEDMVEGAERTDVWHDVTSIEPLILWEYVATPSDHFRDDGVPHAVVACPWPPQEDAAKLEATWLRLERWAAATPEFIAERELPDERSKT